MTDSRPLVAHVVFRFDTGGLENGVANLINRMPADAYRHAVVALTSITDFRRRITREDVDFIALDKPPGHALKIYPQLHRLFRRLRPSIVHSPKWRSQPGPPAFLCASTASTDETSATSTARIENTSGCAVPIGPSSTAMWRCRKTSTTT